MSADAKLKAYIDRILRCREAEDEAKQDTKEVYAELAAEGYEKAIVGQVVTFLRKREKDGDKVAEQSAKFDLYLEAYERPSHAHTREERSDLGLNIQTKHEDIRTAPGTAEESLASGPCEAVSERTATQVDASASAEAGVSGQPEMIPATSAESAGEAAGSASDLPTNSDQPLVGGDHEVASSAERERETVTSNTGEGAANTALPEKPKFVLRPHCLNPGKECGGSGPNHCWSCRRAMQKSEEAV